MHARPANKRFLAALGSWNKPATSGSRLYRMPGRHFSLEEMIDDVLAAEKEVQRQSLVPAPPEID